MGLADTRCLLVIAKLTQNSTPLAQSLGRASGRTNPTFPVSVCGIRKTLADSYSARYGDGAGSDVLVDPVRMRAATEARLGCGTAKQRAIAKDLQ